MTFDPDAYIENRERQLWRKPAATTVGEHLEGLRATLQARPVPSSVDVTPTDDELAMLLDVEVPPEYQDAIVPKAIEADLKKWAIAVCLQGPPGCGKTRIAWAAYRAARLRQWRRKGPIPCRPDRPRFQQIATALGPTPAPFRIVNEYQIGTDAVWGEGQTSGASLLQFPGILVVDDLGYSPTPSRILVERVYIIAEERRKNRRATWWTTNRIAQEISQAYSPAIWSRINGGNTFNLRGQDRRQESPK